MAENSKIEWTDHTANLWWGCTKVLNNPLCDNCYAYTWANRMGNDVWGDDKPRRAIADIWGKLDKWQRQCDETGQRLKVFTMSMGDIFERSRPLVNHSGQLVSGSTGELRNRLFARITADEYPNLDFQMLTKRPQNVMRMVPDIWHTDWPSNVWIGTSVGDQANADRNIPELLKIPAKVRFLSMEPLLGPIDLRGHEWDTSNGRGLHMGHDWLTGEEWQHSSVFFGGNSWLDKDDMDEYGDKRIHWIIVGGESGHGARPTKPEWVHDVRRQCLTTDVPFFFKQWGEYNEDGINVGKKNAGAILDGHKYQQFPL